MSPSPPELTYQTGSRLGASSVLPTSMGLEPYTRILRWFPGDDETLRVLALPVRIDAVGSLGAMIGVAKQLASVGDGPRSGRCRRHRSPHRRG